MRDLESIYHGIVKWLVVICIVVGLVGFIQTKQINARKSIIQIADLKGFILRDYTNSGTVYYKLMVNNGDLSIITWEDNAGPIVYRFKQKNDNELKFKMSFRSKAIDLSSLKESYNGVLK